MNGIYKGCHATVARHQQRVNPSSRSDYNITTSLQNLTLHVTRSATRNKINSRSDVFDMLGICDLPTPPIYPLCLIYVHSTQTIDSKLVYHTYNVPSTEIRGGKDEGWEGLTHAHSFNNAKQTRPNRTPGLFERRLLPSSQHVLTCGQY